MKLLHHDCGDDDQILINTNNKSEPISLSSSDFGAMLSISVRSNLLATKLI